MEYNELTKLMLKAKSQFILRFSGAGIEYEIDDVTID